MLIVVASAPLALRRPYGGCSARPENEPILSGILSGLLNERRMPPGSLVDAGAAGGRDACHFASIAPQRVIHAVDPSERNIQWITRQYVQRDNYSNLVPLHGGRGDVRGTVLGGRTDGGKNS